MKNSFNERNASIADFGELNANMLNDPMVKEREQKHQEKQAFDLWKQENMVKPIGSSTSASGALVDTSNPFAMIAGQVYAKNKEKDETEPDALKPPAMDADTSFDVYNAPDGGLYTELEKEAEIEAAANEGIMDMSMFKEPVKKADDMAFEPATSTYLN